MNFQDIEERPAIFWATSPSIDIFRADLDHKKGRRGFNAPALAAYAEIEERTIAAWPNAVARGGAFELLDTMALTRACGHTCTVDGIHYKCAALQALRSLERRDLQGNRAL